MGTKASPTALRFVWWNVQDLAHYEIRRAGHPRWPVTRDAYAEKLRRVCHVLQRLFQAGPPELMGVAEITAEAAHDLRDRQFPGYEVHSLATLYPAPGLHVALLHKPSSGFENADFLAVSNVSDKTRPMATLDFRFSGHVIRFYACHWTARFERSGKKWRRLSALELNQAAYKFMNETRPANETPHAIIVGDLNEEPFGMLENWLYASRDRGPSRRRPHYSDESIQRLRLYNCAWRLLGEHHSHPMSAGNREMAGSHYWREKKAWRTYDQVIVSGSLLNDSPPYLDESSVKIASGSSVLPDDFIGGDRFPQKFQWNDGNPTGISDHLPVLGSIVLNEESSCA
jgi:endonuclease/exonuclease/phosphatase family metal-dependent hydrolase